MILLDPAARPVIAHRGGALAAPENTLAAFEHAVTLGVDAVECDVRLSADGHVVVCHDETVDRTTDGRGEIARLRLDALKGLDAAARWRGPERAHGAQRIPLLADVLEACPHVALIIELKTPQVAERALEVVHAAGAAHRVLFGAFDQRALEAPRRAGLPTIASEREVLSTLPQILFRPVNAAPYAALAISPTRYGIPVPLGLLARRVTTPLHVWTVNDVRVAVSCWRRGARGIITDDPAAILRARLSCATL
jgi:glycerophosphoryl diester phosphodiesterase